MSEEGLGLFLGEDKPTNTSVWKMFEEAKKFNEQINLDETVKANENFYIGKQWEGIQANGHPTPQINILKRVVGFIVATITSDNIKVNASPLRATANTDQMYAEPARIVNEEFERLSERLNISSLVRDFARDSAVDGDGCIYAYWDDTIETGQGKKGDIQTEIIENTRVHFGDPNDRDVQTQPYIIIQRRMTVRNAKLRAKRNGIGSWTQIKADDEGESVDTAKKVDGKVTVLTVLWKDDDSGRVWGFECTHDTAVKEAWDLGLKLYPLVWLPWDAIHDSFHGQAMITGLIPNQMFINKAHAFHMLSIMRTAYPKIVYDKTRIRQWDNRVGAAIGINGNITDVAKAIDPPVISPQAGQYIQMVIEQTEESLGATSVALGDTRPDNTSAIIALQKAASTPTEITKQNLYRCIEDLFRIFLDFMSEYYGKREVDLTLDDEEKKIVSIVQENVPTSHAQTFDFGMLKDHPMTLKLDVGASSYYSEIASIQTMDNLLMNNHISILQYLKRLPDGYIPERRALIEEIEQAQMQMQNSMPGVAEEVPMPEGAPPMEEEEPIEIKPGGGYNRLARAINETGEIPL